MSKKLAVFSAFLVLLSFSNLLAQGETKPPFLAPYYPTPMGVVQTMLELGELKPGELLYDLGSGDGRVVIMAAEKFGAYAVGFEIDAKLAHQSQTRISNRKLSHLARIEHQDLMTADFSKPDLIFVYLLPASNEKLRPLLEQQVRKGVRIISLRFPFKSWEPEKVIVVQDPSDVDMLEHKLFLYRR